MRKIVMMLAAAVAMLALGAGSVLAQGGTVGTTKEDGFSVIERSNQTIYCQGVPCTASGNDDLVFERQGVGKKDRILLKGGDDQVRANTYGADKDTIKGSSGYDLIYVNDEDTLDRIYGGKGRDKCYVDARKEAISGCSRVIVSGPPR